MGADNWRFCPQCFKRIHEAAAEKLKVARESYGKISLEQFEKNIGVARKRVEVPDTMREDFEAGINENDDFYMFYKARCTKCDFAYSHKLERFNVFDGKGRKNYECR